MMSSPVVLTVVLFVFASLVVLAARRLPNPSPARVGWAAQQARLMRSSAALIVLGFVLLGLQVGFGDGARPNLVSLPIGTVALKLGLIALGLGMLVGVAGGSRRYRLAVILGVLGLALGLLGFGPWTLTGPSGQRPSVTINDVDFILAATSLAVAMALGIDELRQPESATT